MVHFCDIACGIIQIIKKSLIDLNQPMVGGAERQIKDVFLFNTGGVNISIRGDISDSRGLIMRQRPGRPKEAAAR